MNSKSSGCGGIIAFVFLVAIAMWALAIALWVAGLAVAVGGVSYAGVLIYRAWKDTDKGAVQDELDAEIVALGVESAADLDALLLEWDYAAVTRGIGSPLQESFAQDPRMAERIREQIMAAAVRVRTAPNEPERLRSVLAAEEVRVNVHALLRDGLG